MDSMGPFLLENVLGRGGMGTVYRAKYLETNETVAVKVLSPAFSVDEHFRNRFESEIKALLKLDHPNIVRLVSYGQYEHNLYFAMELVEGKSLFQMQRDGEPFHWREVIRIAKNVALGLRHAHDRGVIHRDLKPGNLLKAFAGIIKITDFGIAKSFGSSQDTGTNVLGTVDFMSPEQAKGQPVTIRSDLYSLGAVMYTLLGGKPPFSGNSVEESMRNLTRVPAPRISRIAPDVPKLLDDLVAQLLEKNPEQRIQTALSLYHQLKQAEQHLKDTSQAITAEHPAVGTSEKTRLMSGPTTSVDGDRKMAQTIPHDVDSEEVDELESDETRADSAKIGAPTGPDLIKADEAGKDYFTTVTDDERKVHLDIARTNGGTKSVLGILVLATLLVVVVGAASFGIFRANQIPTAEQLFAEIEQEWDQPQKRMAAIRTFLAHYPNHENTERVEGREELAKAYHKLIQLRNQRRKPEGISRIEQDFLNIVDGASDDFPSSVEKLSALIVLYENDETVTDVDAQCIAAAKAFLGRLQQDATDQTRRVRSNIENQLERAKTLSKQDANDLYESLIELHEKFEWTEDLLAVARQKLAEINE